jgi:hypothetical protein
MKSNTFLPCPFTGGRGMRIPEGGGSSNIDGIRGKFVRPTEPVSIDYLGDMLF